MNLKYIVSYLGLVPFLYLILDGYFIEILDITFILNLSIFMACIIFTFIGAYNWDFKNNNFILELYGFLPSLFSMIIIILTLLDFDRVILINAIVFAFLLQLIADLLLTLKGLFPAEYYLRLRIPITATLSLSLIILSRLYDSHI